MKKIIPRKSGTSQGQWDAYLFTPDGTKIRKVHTAFSSETRTFGQRGRQGPAVRFGQNIRQ